METETTPTKGNHHRALIIVAVWLLFTSTVLVVGYPKVRSAVEESGVLQLLETQSSQSKTTRNGTDVVVFFGTYDKDYVEFHQQQQRLGGGFMHDSFEALLGGPSLAAIKQGAISYIQAGTQLLGLTVSNQILYLDLSKEYLLSKNLELAHKQLEQTALALDGIKDIVVLVEGKPIK